MNYRISNEGLTESPVIAVVGCGGTGGFVAEGVCRLLGNRPATLALIDHDRVEEHNLRRQPFYQGDVGQFKSQVLAERLSRNFGREIAYSVYPYDAKVHQELFHYGRDGVVLGCVDNPAARVAIAEALWRGVGARRAAFWIDAGNGEHSGQVLIGNTVLGVTLGGGDLDSFRHSFHEGEEICTNLPLPSLQQPTLLAPVPEAVGMDCAEAVEAGGQSPTINQAMATLVLEFLSRLMAGTLTYMAAYLDLEAGALRYVPVEPKAIARITGLNIKQLVAKKPPCAQCGQYH